MASETPKAVTRGIMSRIQSEFRTFGGGEVTRGNPLSVALKDHPLQFAAGVDVAGVVGVVIEELETFIHDIVAGIQETNDGRRNK